MKKIIIAAFLIACTSIGRAQSNPNSGNDHGQNDCQCIGIGIPNPAGDKVQQTISSNTSPSSNQPLKIGRESMGLWYIYTQYYYLQLSNMLHPKSGK